MMWVVDQEKTGLRIQELCRENGITVKMIQTKLGLKCPQAVYRWFYGKSLPTVEHLYTIACMLKMPIDELIVVDNRDVSEKHLRDLMQWYSGKIQEKGDLRRTYWETLGVLVFPFWE